MIDQTLLEAVERIAREAGDAIMKVYARDFSVEEKEDKSPLTEADQAAHHVIVRGLKACRYSCQFFPKRTWKAFRGSMRKAVIGWSTHSMAPKSSLSVTVNLP